MILQIATSWPPQVGGVGDYACILEEGLRARGLETAALVPGVQSLRSAVFAAKTEAYDLNERIEASGAQSLIVHFSGYGFASRGLCFGLAKAVSDWRSADCSRRLLTVFHEVYATGPVWRLSFWTSGAQKRIALDLARQSDALFVTSVAGSEQLSNLIPDREIDLLPVFSTIGEIQDPKPLSHRQNRAVVFGGRQQRKKVYDTLALASNEFSQQLALLGIKEIIDIGPDLEIPKILAGCNVRVLGTLSAADVSAELGNSRVGFVCYPGHVFTKSSIASSYFAHRLLVVNTEPVRGLPRDLIEGQQFVDLKRFMAGRIDEQLVADSGYNWYKPHGIAATGEKFWGTLS